MSGEDPIKNFRVYIKDFIRNNGCDGEDGNGTAPFVPRRALVEYWTPEGVTSLLCSRDKLITANSEVIIRHYLVVFSILVIQSCPERINTFTAAEINDSKLPLLSPPPSYPNAPEVTWFKDFMRSQWKFCPLYFGHTPGSFPDLKELHPNQILPIMEKKKLKSAADEAEDDSVLYRVKLHPYCTDFSDYVAFKIYTKETAETIQFYRNEASMYSQLSKESFDYIVTYRGSFKQAGRRTVVLQYALGDTLQRFFKTQQPPTTFADRMKFWNNFLNLLKGLGAIQDLTSKHRHSHITFRLKGTHQDIRPQNILVCGSLAGNVYGAPFKVADLGKSHIRMVRNGGIDRVAVDQHGSGMYSAPEILRDNKTAIVVAAAADIWSFGGIASEALIWSIWGEEGRMEYQAQRIESTRKTDLNGGHHEGAFHDGDCLLDVVEKWHEAATQYHHGAGIFTKPLSDLILDHMLVADPSKRTSDAAVLHTRWTEISRECRNIHERNKQQRDTLPGEQEVRLVPKASIPIRPNPTSHTSGEGPTLYQGPAKSTEILQYAPEIVGSPSPLPDRLSRSEQHSVSANDTPLGITNGLSSVEESSDRRGSRHPTDRTQQIVDNQPQRLGQQQPEEPPGVSQTTLRETPSYNPTSQGSSVVPGYRNIERANTVEEKDPVTVDDIWETCFEKTGRLSHLINRKARDPLEVFPALERSLEKVKGLKGRDQIFLVDDSVSMHSHRKQVARVARVLSYLLKIGKVDPDKTFELFFASMTSSATDIQKSTRLQAAIEAHVFSEPQCEIGPALDEIVTSVIDDNKPVSIYVFTNGHWDVEDTDKSCGVEGPIGRLTKHILDGKKQKNWAVVQFIRFADAKSPVRWEDRLGQERLIFLDDKLKEILEHKLDIVDTRDSNDDVGRILLGAISPKSDKTRAQP